MFVVMDVAADVSSTNNNYNSLTKCCCSRSCRIGVPLVHLQLPAPTSIVQPVSRPPTVPKERRQKWSTYQATSTFQNTEDASSLPISSSQTLTVQTSPAPVDRSQSGTLVHVQRRMLLPDQEDIDQNVEEWTTGQLLRHYVNPTTLEARVVIQYDTGVEEDFESGAIQLPQQMRTSPTNPISLETDIASTSASALQSKTIPYGGHLSSREQSSDSESSAESSTDDDFPGRHDITVDSDCTLSDGDHKL